jgi:4-hydroxy-tetrahydrodipicolinate synthase
MRTTSSVLLLTTLLSLPGQGTAAAELEVPCATPSKCAWQGIYPTVLTPFCCAGGVDVASLEKQLQHELQCRVHGLLVLGTFGEGQYVSMDERDVVIRTAVKQSAGCVPVVVGIHTCNLTCAREQMLQARVLGASAVLVKYVGNPHASASQVHAFFSELASWQILPIFYYHHPTQTGIRLRPDELASIVALDGVVGVKESILNLCAVQKHVEACRCLGKAYFSSTALNLTQFLDLGGQGAMCPEAVLEPCAVVTAYEAYRAGRADESRRIQRELYVMLPILRSSWMPACMTRSVTMCASDCHLPLPMLREQPQAKLKAALNCLGVPTKPIVKCPLPPLTKLDAFRVEHAVARLKDIDWCEVALRVPPVPVQYCDRATDGHGLLKTGAFMLGTGVQRDLLRSQGDGLYGLPLE